MVKPGFYNYLITPSKSGEKVSGSKVPLVLLPHQAAFRAFEGSHLASDPYTLMTNVNRGVKIVIRHQDQCSVTWCNKRDVSDVTSAHVTSSWSRLRGTGRVRPHTGDLTGTCHLMTLITPLQHSKVQISRQPWCSAVAATGLSVISPESQFRVGLNIYWGLE